MIVEAEFQCGRCPTDGQCARCAANQTEFNQKLGEISRDFRRLVSTPTYYERARWRVKRNRWLLASFVFFVLTAASLPFARASLTLGLVAVTLLCWCVSAVNERGAW